MNEMKYLSSPVVLLFVLLPLLLHHEAQCHLHGIAPDSFWTGKIGVEGSLPSALKQDSSLRRLWNGCDQARELKIAGNSKHRQAPLLALFHQRAGKMDAGNRLISSIFPINFSYKEGGCSQKRNEGDDIIISSKQWSNSLVFSCQGGGNACTTGAIFHRGKVGDRSQLDALVTAMIPPPSSGSSSTSSSVERTTGKNSIPLSTIKQKLSQRGKANSRILKELEDFCRNPPPNCRVEVNPRNVREWIVSVTGVNGTIYEGERYYLKIIFPSDYPFKPPSVFFLPPAPRHPHIYSNGDICLNLLGNDWKPSIRMSSVVVAILSMMSSAKEKKLPMDNISLSDTKAGNNQGNFMYHDENC